MINNKLTKLLLILVGLFMAQSAMALSISPTGDTSGGNPGGLDTYQVSLDGADLGASFDMEWSFAGGGDDVSATGTFTILEYDAGTGHFDLGISITNTSVVSGDSNPRILSFGFNVAPDLSVNSVDFGAGNSLDDFGTSETFPGFQTIDFCVFSQGCTGGAANSGLASGETDTFVVHMSGDLSEGLILSEFAMKFQAIDSYELPGQPPCEEGGDCNPPCEGDCTQVPEPGTAFLLGLGLLGMVRLRKLIS